MTENPRPGARDLRTVGSPEWMAAARAEAARDQHASVNDFLDDALDEIERLRAALSLIADAGWDSFHINNVHVCKVAREALRDG